MSMYDDIRTKRRIVRLGAWIGVGLAVAALALGVANLEWGPGPVLALLSWTTILATPPMWALLSLDRRPGLLPAAALAATVVGLIEMFGLLLPPVHLVTAILFWIAMRREPRIVDTTARWKRPLMAAALALPLLGLSSHLDPVCTTIAGDGSAERRIDDRAPSGWRLGITAMSISTSSATAGEQTTCTSDTVVWWEGFSGLVLAVAVALPGLVWPPNTSRLHTDTLVV